MTMTEQRPAQTDTMRVAVLCTGWLKTGRLCNRKLTVVSVDTWERDMSSEAPLVCPKCGTRYSLSQYK